MHRIQLLFSIIALFVRIELLSDSICRLCRANGVAVFGTTAYIAFLQIFDDIQSDVALH